MEIPTNLKHKPVIVAEDYAHIDGRSAYESDAQGLSLGLAQWNDRGRVDISAKVWRHTGEKWSRQSEELPLCSTSGRRPTATPADTTGKTPSSTGWASRGTP